MRMSIFLFYPFAILQGAGDLLFSYQRTSIVPYHVRLAGPITCFCRNSVESPHSVSFLGASGASASLLPHPSLFLGACLPFCLLHL